MAQINPYINFNGNAEEAFLFYKSVFGGEFAQVTHFKEMESAEFPIQKAKQTKLCTLHFLLDKMY